jgi:CelD/BcsL family acetyltransferase involved in cellulose biosynthesis
MPSLRWHVRDLLRATGLKAWRYENLVAQQLPASASRRLILGRSPRVCLQNGFECYIENKTRDGSSMPKTVRNKFRLLERDHGGVTFIQSSYDEAALDQLLYWKAERFSQGHFPPWVGSALKHFFRCRHGNVVGVLSLLKADDNVVASHFGLKVGSLLYYWFPAFNAAFAKYTPSSLLIWHLLKHLHEIDCSIMDFGPGGEEYKTNFASDYVNVGCGIVEASLFWSSVKRGMDSVETGLRRLDRAAPWVRRPLSFTQHG